MGWNDPPVSDNVWIGELPEDFDQPSLEAVFGAYGNIVECRHLPSRNPGQRSSALVRFGTVDEAKWLVENLNGNLAEGLDDHPIVVRFANKKEGGGARGVVVPGVVLPRSSLKDNGGSNAWTGQKPQPPPGDNLWIGDLPSEMDKEWLKDVFTAYGNVVDSRILPPRTEGEKACAMVRFATLGEAKWLVDNLNGNIPEGLEEPIVVRYANAKTPAASTTVAPLSATWGKASSSVGGAQRASTPYGKGGGVIIGKAASTGGGKGSVNAQALVKGALKGGVYGNAGRVPDDCVCYVQGLPVDMTDLELYKLFSPFGAIPPNGVKVMLNTDGTCDGRGFVDFVDPSAAATAVLALNDFQPEEGGLYLKVSVKTPSKNKQEGGKGKGKDKR